MPLTGSDELPLGAKAPDFTLPDTNSGGTVSRKDFSGQPLLVVFMCNHCPYVVHLVEKLAEDGNAMMRKGLGIVAISANDVENYPDDSPEKMTALAKRYGFDFPYLYDESQDTARAYKAVCTPDIFLFDAEHKLYYHGQFDSSRPKRGSETSSAAVSGEDLAAAVDALLAGKAAPEKQIPCVGCGIKWKAA